MDYSKKDLKESKISSKCNFPLIIIVIIAQIALVIYTINSAIECKNTVDDRINYFIKSELQEKRYKRQINDSISFNEEPFKNQTNIFDSITNDKLREYCLQINSDKNEESQTMLPNLDACKLRRVGIPLYNAFVPKVYYGSYLKDAMPKRADYVNKLWLTKGFNGRSLHEYDNLTQLDNKIRPSHVYHLPHNYYGTGHVIYQGSFYYHSYNQSNLIIRYDLALRKIIANYTLNINQNDINPKICYIYNKHREHIGCLDFSVDENGLWLIYRNGSRKTIFVSKLNQDDLTIQRTIEIDLYGESIENKGKRRDIEEQFNEAKALPILKESEDLLNGFIICGKIYFLQYSNTRNLLIRIVHDLFKKNELNYLQSIKFLQPFLRNSQLTYNPYDRKLYAWDSEYLLTYSLETLNVD